MQLPVSLLTMHMPHNLPQLIASSALTTVLTTLRSDILHASLQQVLLPSNKQSLTIINMGHVAVWAKSQGLPVLPTTPYHTNFTITLHTVASLATRSPAHVPFHHLYVTLHQTSLFSHNHCRMNASMFVSSCKPQTLADKDNKVIC